MKLKFVCLLFILSDFVKGQTIHALNADRVIQLGVGDFQGNYLLDSNTNEQWFSFFAESSRMTFTIRKPEIEIYAPIDSLILYTSQNGLFTKLAWNCSKYPNSDSTPAIQVLNLTKGAIYYMKVTKFINSTKKGYFNLSEKILPDAITPQSCSIRLCQSSTNLVCNGDFEVLPSWNIGNCYADLSATYPNGQRVPATAGYCISSPNLRYDSCNFYPNMNNFTDIYVIGNYMASYFQNTAEHGNNFMGIDLPSAYCLQCYVYGYNPLYIWTPYYTATAWQQTIHTIPGAEYEFSCWLEDIDDGAMSNYPGPNVSIQINDSILFSDIISYGNGYSTWKEVSFCWLANNDTANIQVIGQGDLDDQGYDFGIDNISFLQGLAYTKSLMNIACNANNNGSATINISEGASPYTYLWMPGGGTNETESGLSSQVYTVTIIDSSGCQTSDTVSISQPPAIQILHDSLPDYGSCNGSAWVNASNGTAPYTYSWSNGLTTDTIDNQCHGVYCLFLTDANGCLDSTCINIPLFTGINNISFKNSELSIIPNPSNGIVTVYYSSACSSYAVLKVTDLTGRELYTQQTGKFTGEGHQTIDLSNLSEGVYFLKFISNEEQIVKKLVIE